MAFLIAGGAIALVYQRQRAHWREAREALKAAQARLASENFSELQYHLALESARLGFASLTADGKIAFANRRFGEMTGYELDELVERRVASLFSPEAGERWSELFDLLRTGAHSAHSSELQLVRKDRKRFWTRISLSVAASSPHQRSRIFLIAEDISDRNEARAALKAQKDLLDLALSAGRLGAFRMDLGSGTLTGSRTFWKILGLSPASSRSIQDLSTVVHPTDWPKFVGEGGDRTSGDYDVEIRIEAPGKSERWIGLRGREEERNGRLVRIGVAVDLTAHREAGLLGAVAKKHEYMALELQHRLSNLFPVIIGLVNMVDAEDVAEHKEALVERMRALAAVHNLLSKRLSGSSQLREIVLQELKPFQAAHHISIGGPAVLLSSGAAESFSMVVHELATNSVKHGALNDPSGRLKVRWRMIGEAAKGDLFFEWHEFGRRNSLDLPRQGFGSSIIGVNGMPLIGHSPRLEMLGDGMRYSLQLPRSALGFPPEAQAGLPNPGALPH